MLCARLRIAHRIPMILKQLRSFRKWLLRSSSLAIPYTVILPRLCYLSSYEILNDPNTREVYDSYGMAGLAGAGEARPGGMNAEDLFAQFFGAASPSFGFDFGPGAGGPNRKWKAKDEVLPYDVTLEDLYNGKTVKMNMEKDVACGVCKG